jgi:hypothetical protein
MSPFLYINYFHNVSMDDEFSTWLLGIDENSNLKLSPFKREKNFKPNRKTFENKYFGRPVRNGKRKN